MSMFVVTVPVGSATPDAAETEARRLLELRVAKATCATCKDPLRKINN